MAKAFEGEYRLRFHNRLQTDFPFFARYCLKIKTKDGAIAPFILNRAQQYTHDRVEEQLARTGRVRVLILKARQEGLSTYIGGRFYWKTTRLAGKSTFILSHEASTTEKLFQMVARFQSNCPDPIKLTPETQNQRRLAFANGSEYFVGTAGNEDVGRGGTIQHLHASEAAFYQNAIGFSTGLLQSVPDAVGTEVFIESTAKGMDATFYPMCMNALQGKGDYILIFIPWFWQEEYRRKAPEGFQPAQEEAELAKAYGLDNDQLYWRRLKIIELKDPALFSREYPCSTEEAFTVSGESLIPGVTVVRARKSDIEDTTAPLIIGADPNEARGPVGIVWRRGRRTIKTRIVENRSPMELVSLFANIIDEDRPDKMFLDNGNGYGIVDRLCELGYDKVCMGVDFGGAATEDELYLNKRAEMGCAGAQWFINGGVRIPDDDLFHKHLCCVPKRQKTSSNKTKLEAKEKIIVDTQIDPHLFDAFILTFAYPVRSRDIDGVTHSRIKKVTNTRSPLKSVRRRDQFMENRLSAAGRV